MCNVGKIIFKSGLPGKQRGRDFSEVVVVPFFPKAPSSHKEDVHDHFSVKTPFHVCHHVKSVPSPRPSDIEFVPAPFTEFATKEKMFNCFLHMIATKQAVEVRPNIVMPSFQHVARVEAIHKQEPSKNFDFRDTFGLPKPRKSLMSNNFSKTELVVRSCLESRGTPGANPAIICLRKCGRANF